MTQMPQMNGPQMTQITGLQIRQDAVALRRGTLAMMALTCVIAAAAPAGAQTHAAYSGVFTPYVGVTAGGDADDPGFTAGASLAVIEDDGWGVELDVGHAVTVGDEGFDESGLTSAMLNLLYIWPRTGVQPFGVVGAGLLRLSGAIGADGVRTSHTDVGLMVGGGVHVPLTPLVGIRGDARYLRFLDGRPDVPPGKGLFGAWRFSAGVQLNWPLEP